MVPGLHADLFGTLAGSDRFGGPRGVTLGEVGHGGGDTTVAAIGTLALSPQGVAVYQKSHLDNP